jgi:hypothetical protein
MQRVSAALIRDAPARPTLFRLEIQEQVGNRVPVAGYGSSYAHGADAGKITPTHAENDAQHKEVAAKTKVGEN